MAVHTNLQLTKKALKRTFGCMLIESACKWKTTIKRSALTSLAHRNQFHLNWFISMIACGWHWLWHAKGVRTDHFIPLFSFHMRSLRAYTQTFLSMLFHQLLLGTGLLHFISSYMILWASLRTTHVHSIRSYKLNLWTKFVHQQASENPVMNNADANVNLFGWEEIMQGGKKLLEMTDDCYRLY